MNKRPPSSGKGGSDHTALDRRGGGEADKKAPHEEKRGAPPTEKKYYPVPQKRGNPCLAFGILGGFCLEKVRHFTAHSIARVCETKSIREN